MNLVRVFVFATLILLTIATFYSISHKQGYDLNGLEIPKHNLDSFAEVYGDVPFQVCEIDTNKCQVVVKLPDEVE